MHTASSIYNDPTDWKSYLQVASNSLVAIGMGIHRWGKNNGRKEALKDLEARTNN